MEASIAMRKRMNAILDLPFAFSQLAEGFAARGDIERARSTLLDAVEMGQRNTDLWYQAEIQRQLGDLALAERKADDAGKYYRRSLEIAREQGGRSPELRTSVSLARLLVTSGKSAEAAELLGPIRDWFRAQRATVDFIAAETLLEQIDA